MAGINKVIIIGNLGADPELRYSPQGMAFSNFSVATTELWSDKSTGEKQERTEWHKIVAFGKTAENCAKYLAKGRQVYVEGRLQTSSYEKDGQTHYITKIMADTVNFLGTKQDGAGYNQGGGSYQQAGGYQPPRQQQPPNQNFGSYPGGGGYQGDGTGYQYSGNASKANPNSQPMQHDPGMVNNNPVPPDDDIPF
ncbi:MAG: single-stranded DNA-binding protein [Desulfamplus sp.]|nr:single-stranded DNA-binding protein [Desulfamplus sp.]